MDKPVNQIKELIIYGENFKEMRKLILLLIVDVIDNSIIDKLVSKILLYNDFENAMIDNILLLNMKSIEDEIYHIIHINNIKFSNGKSVNQFLKTYKY